MPRIRMRINAHLSAHLHIYLYISRKCTELVYMNYIYNYTHIYINAHRHTRRIFKVVDDGDSDGGGDDTGGSGCTGDRLGESLGTRSEGGIGKGEGEKRDVGERVTGSGTVDAASQEKRRKTRLGTRGRRKQRDRDEAEEWQGGGIGRKQQRHQQLPLSGRLAVIMRNKLPL